MTSQVLLVALGACSITSSIAATGLALDPSWPFDLQITTLALQGLANRASPAVWLYEPVFWTSNSSTEWFAANYFPSRNISVSSVNSICELYAALPKGTVVGTAMYDANALDASRWLAITVSGLDSLVPLSNETLAALPCLSGLPIKTDYRNPKALGWTTNIVAYEWAMTHLLPRCDPSRVYSAGHSYNDSTGGVWVSCATLFGADSAREWAPIYGLNLRCGVLRTVSVSCVPSLVAILP
jgi:hypothetical protein